MTSIPPPIVSATSAAGAPTAPAGQPAAVLTQLPGAQPTTPGTVITGTVVGRDNQGQFLLQTDAGVVAFKSAAALTVGSQVSLQIQAVGSQLQAVILSALAAGTKGATNQAAPGRTPATGGAPTAPATTIAPSVSGGAVVTATVIGPSGAPVPASTTGHPPSTAAGPTVNTANTAPQASTPATARAALPGTTLVTNPNPQSTPTTSPLPSTASPAASTTPSAATLVAQQAPAGGPADVSTVVARYAATSGNVTTGASPTPSTPTATPQPSTSAAQAPGSPVPSPLQPAATGTTVQLRLAGPAPGTPAPPGSTPVTGTLVAHTPNGQTLIDTPVGRLTLNLPAGLGQPKIGSPIALEIVSVGGGALSASSLAATNAARTLPTLGQDWPTLKAAISVLTTVDPSLARQLVDVILPRLGTPRFLSQLLGQLVTGGPADSRSLLGATAHALLERAGRRDVLASLDAELREMNRLNSSPSDWRVLFLPIADMSELRQLRVYTRKKKSGDKGKERSGRFIVEAEFEEYGPLQIDGLVQKPRIDVIVRSHAEFTPSMQAGIAEVFGRTCDASGLIGKIFFHAAPHFPVSPLDEIAAHAGPGLSV